MLYIEKFERPFSWIVGREYNCHSFVLVAVLSTIYPNPINLVENSIGAYDRLKCLLWENRENCTYNPHVLAGFIKAGRLVSYHVILQDSELEPAHSGLIAGANCQNLRRYLTTDYMVVERRANQSPIYMYPFSKSGGRWDIYPGEKLLYSVW